MDRRSRFQRSRRNFAGSQAFAGCGCRGRSEATAARIGTATDFAFYYKRKLTDYWGQLVEVVDELFPSFPSKMRRVTMGDIGPCPCGAFIGSKQVEQLREAFHLAGVGRMNLGQLLGTFLCQQASAHIPEKMYW